MNSGKYIALILLIIYGSFIGTITIISVNKIFTAIKTGMVYAMYKKPNPHPYYRTKQPISFWFIILLDILLNILLIYILIKLIVFIYTNL
jgi:hypothetical protein